MQNRYKGIFPFHDDIPELSKQVNEAEKLVDDFLAKRKA